MALHASMIELGEDPEEFSKLHEGIVASFRPSNRAQEALAREIAWLHWERQRLERAQAALFARRIQELEIQRQRKSLEISQKISAQIPAAQMNIGYLWADESPEKFQKLLELLDQLKQCVDAGVFMGAETYIDWIYGPLSTARGAMIKVLFAQLAEIPPLNAAPDDDEEPAMEGETGTEDESPLSPTEPLTVAAAADDPASGEPRDFDAGRSDADIAQHVAVMKLRREIEAEIASVTQQYWLYQRQYVDVTPTMRAECLVPTIEQRWLMRQLYMIDRGIDRKVRLLMDQQWLGRREAVEILPKDDPGAAENSEKKNV
ncbi:MAG TPA: hypothetical protein VGX94_12385 [Terriglobia bacterium]|nr:hypothetical protein [Terriglobia bacterium]